MFAPKHYYAQPQHIDFVVLAGTRAAEAVAKAAEAEYLAQQAEAQARARAQTAHSTRCLDQFSCPCVDYTGPEQSIFGYSPYSLGNHSPRSAYTLGSYGHPQRVRSHRGRSLAELELETDLRNERLARLRLEEEIKQLKAREQHLARSPFVGSTNKWLSHKQSNATHCDDALFGATHDPQHHGLFRFQPTPNPRTIAPNPTPAHKAPATPVDVVLNMILQNIDVNQYKNATAQQVRPMPSKLTQQRTYARSQQAKPKEPTAPEEAFQQQPKKLAHKCSLVDQLKTRYEREGREEICDTIQPVVDSSLNPAKQQRVGQQPSPSTHSTNQARSSVPRAPGSVYGFDLIEAILGNFNGPNQNEPYARPASSNPTRTTPYDASGKASTAAGSTNTHTKGKGKKSHVVGNVALESTSKDAVNALEKIESIEHTFHSLETEFTFPAQLDFAPSSPTRDTSNATAIFPSLAFTARNHPVRYYEQTLSSLLQELDLIESHGDPTLRFKRKTTVRVIEKALEELEREIAGRWSASVAKQETKAASEPTTCSAEAPKAVRIPMVGGETPLFKVALPNTSEGLARSAEDTTLAMGPEISEAQGLVEESQPEEIAEDGATLGPDHISSETDSPLPELSTAADLGPTQESQHVPEIPVAETVEKTATTQFEVPVPENPVTLQPMETGSTSSWSPSSNVIVEDTLRDPGFGDDSDAFVFSHPSPPAFEKELEAKKRRLVEVEDLGSDWEDIDEV